MCQAYARVLASRRTHPLLIMFQSSLSLSFLLFFLGHMHNHNARVSEHHANLRHIIEFAWKLNCKREGCNLTCTPKNNKSPALGESINSILGQNDLGQHGLRTCCRRMMFDEHVCVYSQPMLAGNRIDKLPLGPPGDLSRLSLIPPQCLVHNLGLFGFFFSSSAPGPRLCTKLRG